MYELTETILCDDRPWRAAVAEMWRLAAALPDGVARFTAFAAVVDAAGPDDRYVARQPGIVDGRVVVTIGPGRLAVEFLEMLRALAAGKGGAK